MFWRRGTDPVKLALVLASIYLMYNSWSLSDLNIRHDRVNSEKILIDFLLRQEPKERQCCACVRDIIQLRLKGSKSFL